MPETRRTTAADIIRADEERADQARFAALDELRSEYAKVVGPKSLRRWRKAVNRRFVEILGRVN